MELLLLYELGEEHLIALVQRHDDVQTDSEVPVIMALVVILAEELRVPGLFGKEVLVVQIIVRTLRAKVRYDDVERSANDQDALAFAKQPNRIADVLENVISVDHGYAL